MSKTVNYNLLSEFGKRVEMKRQEVGISRKELVERIGYGLQEKTYRLWIHKKGTKIDIDRLGKLCEVLNVDADYLMGRIDKKTHDNKWICEKTGLSENTVERLMEKNQKICKALNYILPHQYGEEICSELLAFIDMAPFRPYIEISASQDKDVTFLSDVDSLSLNGRSVDSDILRQAIIVNLQWLLTGVSDDAEKDGLLSGGNGVKEGSLFYTTRALSKYEAPFTPISD